MRKTLCIYNDGETTKTSHDARWIDSLANAATLRLQQNNPDNEWIVWIEEPQATCNTASCQLGEDER